MNERIKQLADQCEDYGSWDNKTYTFDKEKFAQLIVKECADQFKLVYTDEHYQRRIDKTILKHFGFYE
jgi:uncharacterized protein YaaW (UPF0174 family)